MKALFNIALTTVLMSLVACSEPTPPRSVSTFLENPYLLDAALVRCAGTRSSGQSDAECSNAREAVGIIEAKLEASRRVELEKQSQRKRDALRRTQRAVTKARRRVAESQRQREEAEYLAQFGQLPPSESETGEVMTGNAPVAVIPEAVSNGSTSSGYAEALPAVGSNAPIAEVAPEEEPPTELETIRDELNRRNEEGNEQ